MITRLENIEKKYNEITDSIDEKEMELMEIMAHGKEIVLILNSTL